MHRQTIQIEKRDWLILTWGAFCGIVLMYFASRNWFLSLLMGVTCGIGGPTVVLLAVRLLCSNRRLSGYNFHHLNKKEKKRGMLNLMGAVVAIVLWALLSDARDNLTRLVMLLFAGSLLAGFIYDWMKKEPTTNDQEPQ